jgi:hypothetical protein
LSTSSILVDPLFVTATVDKVVKDDLVRLSTSTLACIHHRGFLSPQLLARLSQLVDEMPLTPVNQGRVYPPVLRFGPTLNDFAVDKQLHPDYWEAAARASNEWRAAHLPYNPFETCLAWVGEVWGSSPQPVRIGGRPLLAGTIRKSVEGLRVHFDDVAREFPQGLFDQKVVAQLALNVYLSVPRVGGETTIWRHTWEPADEAVRAGYGYDEGLLAEIQSVTIRPREGDALLFSPRFYHCVAASPGEARVSVAMFLGITADGTIAVWS